LPDRTVDGIIERLPVRFGREIYRKEVT